MSEMSILNPMNQLPLDLTTLSENRLDGKIQAAQSAAADKRKAELKKAAQEFEAIFIAQLLKVMRDTIEEAGLTEGGFGKSIYTEMFDQEIALDMARHGTLGISNLLCQRFAAVDEADENQSGNVPAAGPAPTPLSPASFKEQGEGGCEITDLQLPVQAPISSAFGMRKDPFTHRMRFHKGLDLAAPEGMKVAAALPGTVVSAGYESGYGNTVLLQHAGGLQTRYGHLASINVKAGDVVSAESTLGAVGTTGRSTGPHLHFEVIRMGVPVNPILSSSAARVEHGSGTSHAGS